MKSRLAVVASSALLSFALVSCARGRSEPFWSVEDDGGDGRAPPPSGFDTDEGPSLIDYARPECADRASQQIYVVGTDLGFYRFDPEPLTFERVGTLGCPTTASTFSMAIDRRGVAWVEYTDGRIYAVDTHDARCEPTPFEPGKSGLGYFGMGFALNSDDPKDGETLYLAGQALVSLDTRSFDVTFLGSLAMGRAELTAIGRELYAFSLESGVIARIDKQSGATKTTYRTSAIDDTGGFAFAHWGGQFWIFSGRTSSAVTRYSPETDDSTTVIANTEMLIVGAGSSTCAPGAPPI